MSAKRQRHCPALLAIREEAFMEWTKAERFDQVRSCWGRLGGRTTLHRYGRPPLLRTRTLATLGPCREASPMTTERGPGYPSGCPGPTCTLSRNLVHFVVFSLG